ncbi:mannitol dehydrogenase family protein [Notoacmeibacter sp. MSK16QG-6]|uniref:mannitol dehydrogenase family protein n=1 Tax=Notoacmeibacter sp. MSK16QG-6 TaxID=2957982 RepID=UPI0020A0C605|nr:mannitol dehydrogenase family protein [Notoacmeibacter sp. MSK16QG-6]MCP1199405.1 mannitol dehydrogenase family protein [Notoacmeibacter sp. MSK16QG-6]
MAVRLNMSALPHIESADVPSYDRSALKPGILHIGVGNFHRAHQAVYLDRLFETGRDHDWAFCGAGLMPFDTKVHEVLASQDFLSTTVAQEADSTTARVTGPMVEFVVPEDPQAIVDRLADPAIRIVSLTITEGGYFLNADGHFNATHPAIVADAKSPDKPSTVFGVIVKALQARRDAGQKPFTVMSCDNLPHNGRIAREAVTGLAGSFDRELADWIENHVAFPNAMVDRITPATGERERQMVREMFDIEDEWPVFCEQFSQWVLEDKFVNGRPALETVGVQFVEDVTPYEVMKIRILNGGHAIIAYPAGLMDIHFVHEAMENDLIRDFLTKVEEDEIIPVVPPVPDTDLNDYHQLTHRRFANPKIGDTIRRLCLDGSNRQPKFIVPSIVDNLERGKSPVGLALESALWCRYCYGETDSGAVIEPNDPNWDRLKEVAQAAKHDPSKWLAMTDIYGDLGKDKVFAKIFADWLESLWQNGTKVTLRQYLER